MQAVTGIAGEGGRAMGVDQPRPLPCQALDHASGYLAAFGTMVALAKRATQGGSWMVRICARPDGALDRPARPRGRPRAAEPAAGGRRRSHGDVRDMAEGSLLAVAPAADSRPRRDSGPAPRCRSAHIRRSGPRARPDDARVSSTAWTATGASSTMGRRSWTPRGACRLLFLLGMRRQPDGRWLVPCPGRARDWFEAQPTHPS